MRKYHYKMEKRERRNLLKDDNARKEDDSLTTPPKKELLDSPFNLSPIFSSTPKSEDTKKYLSVSSDEFTLIANKGKPANDNNKNDLNKRNAVPDVTNQTPQIKTKAWGQFKESNVRRRICYNIDNDNNEKKNLNIKIATKSRNKITEKRTEGCIKEPTPVLPEVPTYAAILQKRQIPTKGGLTKPIEFLLRTAIRAKERETFDETVKQKQKKKEEEKKMEIASGKIVKSFKTTSRTQAIPVRNTKLPKKQPPTKPVTSTCSKK